MPINLKPLGTSQRPGAVVVHCKDDSQAAYELPLGSAEAAMLVGALTDAIQNWRGDAAKPCLLMPVVKATVGRVEIAGKSMAFLRIYVTESNYHDYAIDPETPSGQILLAMAENTSTN